MVTHEAGMDEQGLFLKFLMTLDQIRRAGVKFDLRPKKVDFGPQTPTGTAVDEAQKCF